MGIFNRGGRGGGNAPAERPLGGTGSTPAPTSPPEGAPRGRRSKSTENDTKGGSVANIGKSIVFKGELSGDEDLQIDGQVEGTVSLPGNELTIGVTAQITAEVSAKSVQVVGKITGNVTATERVEVHSNGEVKGDIKAPKLLIQEGAVINGGIQMTEVGAAAAPKAPSTDAEGSRKSA